MAKKQEQKNIEDIENEITQEQLKLFEAKASEYNNEQELLVALKAIRIGQNGTWIVMQYEGLKGSECPVTGLTFKNDIPYTLYRELVTMMENKAKRRAYAEKKQLEHYETQVGGSLTEINEF